MGGSFLEVYFPQVCVQVNIEPCHNPPPQRFDELLQLASRGQHSNVDMLVKDIYGGAYESLGLTGDLIASSFGKSATTDKRELGFFNLPASRASKSAVGL